jgi:hypothetical protein
MLVDDVLVFRASLLPSPAFFDLPLELQTSQASSIEFEDIVTVAGSLPWGSRSQPQLAQSLLFTDDPYILQLEVSQQSVNDDHIICYT